MGCLKLHIESEPTLRLAYLKKGQKAQKNTGSYYPFGLKHQGYNYVVQGGNGLAQQWKFGGKEYSEDLGLDWYDITARNYDAALGRWMNIDPLAEMMRRHSPYNYAFDNPIFFNDPDGMMPGASNGGIMPSVSGSKGFAEIGSGSYISITTTDDKGNVLDSENILDSSTSISFDKDDGQISVGGNGSGSCCGDTANVNGALKGALSLAYDMTMGTAVGQIERVGAVITGNPDFELIPKVGPSNGEEAGFYAVYGVGILLDPSPAGEIAAANKGAKALSKVDFSVTIEGKVLTKTDFVVTSNGTTVPIPDGAFGPTNSQRGSGMLYRGGTGGKGMDKRTTGVRIMDANSNQGRRVNFMNKTGQTIDPSSGRTISNKNPRGHHPIPIDPNF